MNKFIHSDAISQIILDGLDLTPKQNPFALDFLLDELTLPLQFADYADTLLLYPPLLQSLQGQSGPHQGLSYHGPGLLGGGLLVSGSMEQEHDEFVVEGGGSGVHLAVLGRKMVVEVEGGPLLLVEFRVVNTVVVVVHNLLQELPFIRLDE